MDLDDAYFSENIGSYLLWITYALITILRN